MDALLLGLSQMVCFLYSWYWFFWTALTTILYKKILMLDLAASTVDPRLDKVRLTMGWTQYG